MMPIKPRYKASDWCLNEAGAQVDAALVKACAAFEARCKFCERFYSLPYAKRRESVPMDRYDVFNGPMNWLLEQCYRELPARISKEYKAAYGIAAREANKRVPKNCRDPQAFLEKYLTAFFKGRFARDFKPLVTTAVRYYQSLRALPPREFEKVVKQKKAGAMKQVMAAFASNKKNPVLLIRD